MLEPFSKLLENFRARFPQLEGPHVLRKNVCGFCGSQDALLLAKADYWDLAEVQLVRCTTCGLSQIDPMLSEETMATGCLALYRHQQAHESTHSRRRGLYRAFRHGVAFGTALKLKGITPTRVLEVGAGDGFFLKGVQYVFPSAQFVCLDLVKEILAALETEHGFQTIHCALEEVKAEQVGKFDLLIGRDILEHVSQPGTVLEKLGEMLQPGGHLFFITPNGWQDAWQMFSRWNTDAVNSELLINHVNYFDPLSLHQRLLAIGLKPREWFIYNLKTFLRGAGWRLIEKHKARISSRRSAMTVINETQSLRTVFATSVENAIPLLYRIPALRIFAMFYCWFKHTPFVRVNPTARVGEEIYCLAEKLPKKIS